mgnify:CR=1 FL=1
MTQTPSLSINSMRGRVLWPLFSLLLVETLGLVLVFRFSDAPITPFSAIVAAIILATGLLPAVLRPSPEHVLAACLATVFGIFLLIPFDPPINEILTLGPQLRDFSGHLLFRLLNGAAIGPFVLHLSSRFPRRSALSSKVIVSAYAITVGLLVIFFLIPANGFKKWFFALMVLWLFVLVVWAIALLIRISRDPSPEHRRSAQQARLLLFSLVLANSGLLIRLGIMAQQNQAISYNFALAPQIFLPIGISYAILRHDLFEIDSALRRALAYATLSLTLIAGYLALTVTLTALLAKIWPQFRGAAAAIGVLVAAAAFDPLRGRLQRLIDHSLYPDRLKFEQAISSARAQLTQVVNRQQIIDLLTQEVPREIGAEWGSLSFAPAPDIPGHFESKPSWNAQLIVGGSSLGRYWLGARLAGPTFSREEKAQLSTLVGQAALALAYAGTIDELNALNRQLESRVDQRTTQVLTQQRALAVVEERRRLARELHDSVTQTLFSINLSARAIRGMVRKDTYTAEQELSELEISAQDALEEMRTLLSQLRNPPEVTDVPRLVNFSPQLEDLCAQMQGSHGLQITLIQPASQLLPSHLSEEITAILREAFINIAKHSGTLEAVCSAEQQNDVFVIQVSDQGRGFSLENSNSVPQHFGLRGIHERAAALNGTIQIQAQPGTGTAIEARFPLQPAQ